MQFPILIGLRRSRILGGGIFTVTALSSLSSLVYPGSVGFSAFGVFVSFCLGGFAWKKIQPISILIRLERDGRISIFIEQAAEFFPVVPMAGATVHPWLVVVRLRDECGQIVTLVATIDSMSPDDLRRLRVFLRWRLKFGVQLGA